MASHAEQVSTIATLRSNLELMERERDAWRAKGAIYDERFAQMQKENDELRAQLKRHGSTETYNGLNIDQWKEKAEAAEKKGACAIEAMRRLHEIVGWSCMNDGENPATIDLRIAAHVTHLVGTLRKKNEENLQHIDNLQRERDAAKVNRDRFCEHINIIATEVLRWNRPNADPAAVSREAKAAFNHLSAMLSRAVLLLDPSVPAHLTFLLEADAVLKSGHRVLTFEALRDANVRRCESIFHKVAEWSPTDWACAMAGEAGEVCDAVKKLRRLDHGTNTEKDPQTVGEAIADIGEEIADTIMYLDLLAARLGIDIPTVVQAKFNKVSDLRKSPIKL